MRSFLLSCVATILISFTIIATAIVGRGQSCPTAGCLDTTFGIDGFVKTTVNGGLSAGWANAVAVQPDGMIVVAVESGNIENTSFADCYVLRFDPSGALDSLFGTGGVARFALTAAADYEQLLSLVIQPDGKIVGAGKAGNETFVVRLDPNGSLDPTFGVGGLVRFTFINRQWAVPNAVTVDSAGRITVGMNTNNSGFGFARFTASGNFDTSFNGTGKLAVAGGKGATSALIDMVLLPDGKYVASGMLPTPKGSSSQFGLMRVNGNGTLDSSFGSNGRVVTNFGGVWSAARNVAVDSSGNIIAGGDWLVTSTNQSYVFVRYTPNGQLDPSFGSGGKAIFDSSHIRRMLGMAIQTDGYIVGGGWDRVSNSSDGNVMIMRIAPDGTLDSTFGTGGITITDHDGRTDNGNSLAMQPDGKFVIAGSIDGSPATQAYVGLYRFLP